MNTAAAAPTAFKVFKVCLPILCSGPPIGQVARAWRKDAPAAVAAAATRLLAGVTAGAAAAGGRGEGQAPTAAEAAVAEQPQTQAASGGSFRVLEPGSQPVAAMEQDEKAVAPDAGARADAGAVLTAPAATPGGEAREQQQHQQHQQQEAASTVQQGKKARPSSWQRRRAAKQRAQQEAEHAVQQGGAERGQGGADGMEVDREGGEWALPATQDFARLDPLATQAAQALAAAAAVFPEAAAAGAAAAEATAAAAGAGAAAGAAGNVGGVAAGAAQRSSWPQRMPRPTDMLLQRSSIFYCASFPRKPGLTTQRKCAMAAGDGRLALQPGLQLGAGAAMAAVCPMHSLIAAADPAAGRTLRQTCCTS